MEGLRKWEGRKRRKEARCKVMRDIETVGNGERESEKDDTIETVGKQQVEGKRWMVMFMPHPLDGHV